MQWWCAAQGVAWSWSWQPYPGVWLLAGLMAFTYVRLLRGRGTGGEDSPSVRARAWFAGVGIVVLWAALDWPLGALGAGYLASVHMVQFLLIALVAPPFLLLGVPDDRWAGWTRGPVRGHVLGLAGNPLVSLSVFTIVLGFTHWPVVVDGLMASQLGNFVLDILWLASGLLFWWPVIVSQPRRPWLTEPFKMGYLIAATIANTGVFAFLAFSDLPVYATFELAPPVGVLSPRDDQLVAGFLMKIGGAAVFWTAITILFFRWFGRGEREPVVLTSLLLAVAVSACGPSGTALSVEQVLLSEPVAGQVAGLYLTVENAGPLDVLVSLEVEGAGQASLHRTDEVEGMMRMRAAPEGLVVPAEGVLRLRPGGDHVMLDGLVGEFEVGALVPVLLHFELAGPVATEALVVPLSELAEAVGGG